MGALNVFGSKRKMDTENMAVESTKESMIVISDLRAELEQCVNVKRSRTEQVAFGLEALDLDSTPPDNLWLCPVYSKQKRKVVEVEQYMLPVSTKHLRGSDSLPSLQAAHSSINQKALHRQVLHNLAASPSSQHSSDVFSNLIRNAAQGGEQHGSGGSSNSGNVVSLSPKSGALVVWSPPVDPEKTAATAACSHVMRSHFRRLCRVENSGVPESSRAAEKRILKQLENQNLETCRGKASLKELMRETVERNLTGSFNMNPCGDLIIGGDMMDL